MCLELVEVTSGVRVFTGDTSTFGLRKGIISFKSKATINLHQCSFITPINTHVINAAVVSKRLSSTLGNLNVFWPGKILLGSFRLGEIHYVAFQSREILPFPTLGSFDVTVSAFVNMTLVLEVTHITTIMACTFCFCFAWSMLT
jgi:hypothetical protein